MFEEYPKRRGILPPRFARIHESHYKLNRRGGSPATSLSQRMECWLHRRVAADLLRDRTPRATLEIGAGTLNQLPYEPQAGPYDIIEPFEDLYQSSPFLGRVRNIYRDIREVPTGTVYDRVTTIATFEHVCDLPEVVAHAGLLLGRGGTLRVSIPSEGTPLWKLGWMLTTGIEFRFKYGLDYGTFLRYEHVNTARDIEEVLRYFFADVRCELFGLTRAWSFYQFFECRDPVLDRCRVSAGSGDRP